MFCAKCGKEVEDNIKFCSSCGNQLIGEFEQINPSATITPVNIVGKVKVQKDIGIAVILAIIFGPVGVFYVSIKGALILIAATIAGAIPAVIAYDKLLQEAASYGSSAMAIGLTYGASSINKYLAPPDSSIFYFFVGISLIIPYVVTPIFAYKTAKKTHEIDTILNNTITNKVGAAPTSTNFTEEASVSVSKSKIKKLILPIIGLIIGALLILWVYSSKNTSTDYSAQVTAPVIESQSNATSQLEGAVKADEYYESSNSLNNKENIDNQITLDGGDLSYAMFMGDDGKGKTKEAYFLEMDQKNVTLTHSFVYGKDTTSSSMWLLLIGDNTPRIICEQSTKEAKMVVANMSKKGFATVAGDYARVSGGIVYLTNCTMKLDEEKTATTTVTDSNSAIRSSADNPPSSQSTKSIDGSDQSATDNVAMSLVLKLLDYAMIDGGIKNESQMQEIISQLNVQLPQGDKNAARKLNDEALIFFKNNDIDNAEKMFTEALDANPYDAEIANNAAFMQLKQKRFNDAKSTLLYTLALAPNRANAWMNLGDVFASLGDINKAVASFSNTFRFSKNKMNTLRLMEKLNENEDVALLKQARELAKVWAVKNYPAELQL
jgi:TolA-binding protein